MQFPLTQQLIDEARRFELRSACRDCSFWLAARGACVHGWPDEGQRRWPLDAHATDEPTPTTAAFCKEFELR
ncbi:MAG: hypothetical protein IPL61_34520 [Myxococcales bacterium]|nr:hypothetical protein [Myxococcales bacterium]